MPPANFGFHTTAEEAATHYAPQIRDKVILVTGVSPGGLGAYFAEAVAKQNPKLVILAGRDPAKVAETAKAIAAASPDTKTRDLILDLGSQEQVRAAAKEVNAYEENIDILLNNAGLMACPYSTTKDGLEKQFGTNHIGHFLFTNLILDKILASGPGARVVNATSAGHRFSPIRFEDWQFSGGETYHKWKAYGQSKTANILFSLALAERLGSKGLASFSVHPGAIMTNLARSIEMSDVENLNKLDEELGNTYFASRKLEFKTLSQGTSTYFVAAFDPDLVVENNGAYLSDCKITPDEQVLPHALDKEDARKLWKLSEEIVGQPFNHV